MIPLPEKLKIMEKKGNKAVFQIEGLYPGYGMTLGNSLRRVLFSSLEGAAVTQVKIKGANHEFAIISGVLEDVISIILNIKQLRFKLHSDESQKALLKIKGEKEVKGSDIELPTQVELINKDVHIATITDKKTELEIEFQIERGLGYVSSEQAKGEKLEVGQISVDAIFTPIKSVNFRVENMRVGKRTDFDRLFIEVETDGTIDPEEALRKASKIIADHFAFLAEDQKKEEDILQEAEKDSTEREDAVKEKVEDMKIGSRTANILIKNSIKTIAGLLKKTEDDLLALEGMGAKGVEEIKKALKKMDLKLKS